MAQSTNLTVNQNTNVKNIAQHLANGVQDKVQSVNPFENFERTAIEDVGDALGSFAQQKISDMFPGAGTISAPILAYLKTGLEGLIEGVLHISQAEPTSKS